ncbi:MAG: lysylphosphatidylglycerol synthase domain-containing protein [Bacteroidota bacterium]
MIEQLQYTISSWRPKIWSVSFLSILIKTLILLGVVYYLVQKLGSIDSIVASTITIQLQQLHSGFWLLGLIVLLMPFNWFLEAKKWQVLAKPFKKISISESFHGVLCGLSLGFVTPHALGDYAGKALSVDVSERKFMVAPIFVGRLSQMLMTLVFGFFGLNQVLLNNSTSWNTTNILLVMVLAIMLIFLVVRIFRKSIYRLMRKSKRYFTILKEFSSDDYLKVIAFSAFRYLIFCSQFLLTLYLFDIPLSTLILFYGVTWIFLIKSSLPSFNFLSDLGIREFSAIYFFSFYGIDEILIVAASLMLWLVNLLIPSLIGSFFILKMKIFR